MFNFAKTTKNQETDLLQAELEHFDIFSIGGKFDITIGDEEVKNATAEECLQYIDSGIKELKYHIWFYWNDLRHLSILLLNSQNKFDNHNSISNTLFLHSARKSFLLSRVFSELNDVSNYIVKMFNFDIADFNHELIEKFNETYLEIKITHRLIMNELYKKTLLNKYINQYKFAQVSGPWANLDLPMEERMWSAAEDEEYFDQRTRARKEQPRYNPEVGSSGFYYVWQDRTRDPYAFTDIDKDSPYKSNSMALVP